MEPTMLWYFKSADSSFFIVYLSMQPVFLYLPTPLWINKVDFNSSKEASSCIEGKYKRKSDISKGAFKRQNLCVAFSALIGFF